MDGDDDELEIDDRELGNPVGVIETNCVYFPYEVL